MFWSLDRTVLKSEAEGMVGRLHVPPKGVQKRDLRYMRCESTQVLVKYVDTTVCEQQYVT